MATTFIELDFMVTVQPNYRLYTAFDDSTVAEGTGHAGELRDCGTDSGRTDVDGLAAHGTGKD